MKWKQCTYLRSNFLPQKTLFFPHEKYFPKSFWLLFTFILCNFSVRTLKYFQKNCKLIFLSIKTLRNGPQKLLIIGPNPFISQSSPDHSPQLRNWFFILWNLGTRHLFSYLCNIIEEINTTESCIFKREYALKSWNCNPFFLLLMHYLTRIKYIRYILGSLINEVWGYLTFPLIYLCTTYVM